MHAILGGSLKGGDFAALVEPGRRALRRLLPDRRGRRAARARPGAGRQAGVELQRCGDLADAVRAAAGAPEPGEVVLLSPACASFDAYRDFEERGEHFRALVAEDRRLAARPDGSLPLRRDASAQIVGALAQPSGSPRARTRAAPPVEYNLLLTATLCLLAFGVVMVFSASSTTSLLGKEPATAPTT